jgi:hypothetical protein
MRNVPFWLAQERQKMTIILGETKLHMEPIPTAKGRRRDRRVLGCLARMSPDWVQQAIALLLQIFYDGAKIDRLIREPSILGNLGLI